MKAKSTAPKLDLEFAHASPVIVAAHSVLRLVLVGCGGTGSHMAHTVAQLARVLSDSGRSVEVLFVDPDHVEQKNVPRQNFCPAELGLNKAETLANRYASAWGLDIQAVTAKFHPDLADPGYNGLTVLIGCVDTAAGRKAMHAALKHNDRHQAPRVWHLDCGNAKDYGQVRIGATADADRLGAAFATRGMCTNLPAPGLQAPDLLAPPPDEEAPEKLSCAELIALNAQSLVINKLIASVASDYLVRLLLTSDLKRFATFVSASACSSRSLYTTLSTVAACLGIPERRLGTFSGGRRRRRAA